MIYHPIKNKSARRFGIYDFSDGIKENARRELSDRCALDECVNLINKNGRLETRDALRVLPSFTGYGGASGSLPFKLTDTVYYLNGKKHNVAYYSAQEEGYGGVRVFLISDGENVVPAGFIRRPDVAAYDPESIVFTVGAKTKGFGIYAFITASAGGTVYHDVFEAPEPLNGDWLEITDSDRYVPTLLINGRGNLYSQSVAAYNTDLPQPEKSEKRNLISSAFRAYYSADGFSWSFNLPLKDLDQRTVNCKVYFTPAIFTEFNIPPGGEDTKAYGSFNFTARCDYRGGRLIIVNSSDSSGLPRSAFCPLNNIVVTAYKTKSDGISGVCSCGGVVFFNSKAYLYKSAEKPNFIYSCRLSNPLYFPENAVTEVGSATHPITAAGYQNDKLIVFNRGETYKINTGAAAKTVDFESPAVNPLAGTDALTNQTISTKVGCGFTDTVAACAGQMIWLGSDKKVYTLEATTYGSEKNIFCISEQINKRLAVCDFSAGAFAAVRDGFYYLFCGRRVFVCDCRILNMGYAPRYGWESGKSVSWYEWELPVDDLSSCKNCGELMATAAVPGQSRALLYRFENAGNDLFTDISGDAAEPTEKEISVSLLTNAVNIYRKGYKKVRGAEFDMNAKRANIEIITDKGAAKTHIHSIKKNAAAKVPPHAQETKKVAFRVSAAGNFGFEAVTVDLER